MRQLKTRPISAAIIALGLTACAIDPGVATAKFEAQAALDMAEALSRDDLQGRRVGTAGNQQARSLIAARMAAIGLQSFADDYAQNFIASSGKDGDTVSAANLIGMIRGRRDSGLTLVVTAHYDHLGVVDGEIYNGADDNASGVVGMLAIAEYFAANTPDNDVLFVAFDGEEFGLLGSTYFVAHPPVDVSALTFNLNLDMISRGDNGSLWASGTAHNPGLIPMVEAVAVAAPVTVKMGFDVADEGLEDWTLMSDQAAFFKAGIAHLYLGVEDHPDYHKPSDDFAKVDQDWFLKSIETAVMMAAAADSRLAEIAAAR